MMQSHGEIPSIMTASEKLTQILDLKEVLGAYCIHLLAEYLLTVAVPTQVREEGSQALGTGKDSQTLPQEAWARLRQGAQALYSTCSSKEVPRSFSCSRNSPAFSVTHDRMQPKHELVAA